MFLNVELSCHPVSPCAEYASPLDCAKAGTPMHISAAKDIDSKPSLRVVFIRNLID